MNMRILVSIILFCCSASSVMGMSKFREESYHPNAAQREGLALLRIVSSPLALFTEAAQYYNERKEATGDGSPLNFVGGMCIIGPFFVCFEAIGGTLELVSFQQFKSCGYPWEIDPNNEKTVKAMRADWEAEQQRKAENPEPDIFAEAVGAAVGAAVEQSMNKGHKGGNAYVAPSSGGGSKKTSVKPRVKHSSCGGTGTCPICRGRGTVGKGIKCSGCGGSTRCRACRGTGYAN